MGAKKLCKQGIAGDILCRSEGAGFCCQVPADPAYGRKTIGLKFPILGTAYAATAIGALLSFATIQFVPITVVTHRAKANSFRRSSILFRPHSPQMKGVVVETPGTAPGSDPLISSAFMSIVPKDTFYIGNSNGPCKGQCQYLQNLYRPRTEPVHTGVVMVF